VTGLRGPVGWSDALAAAAALGLAEQGATGTPHGRKSLDRLVTLVRLAAVTPAPGPRTAPAAGESPERGDVAVRAAGQVAATAEVSATVRDAPLTLLPAADRRTDAEGLSDAPVDLAGIGTADPLPVSESRPDAVPYEPPIPGQQLRASLVALVRRPRPGRRLDVPRLVAEVVAQRPVRRLPRLTEATTSDGVTVVADVGRAMLVHLQDVERLVAELRQVVGEPRIDVRWVGDGDPVPLGTREHPALVISDLGAGAARTGPSGTGRWGPLLSAARRGADVVALVPHRRTAARLTRTGVAAIAWDDLPLAGRGRG
jgi:hypothetical protein